MARTGKKFSYEEARDTLESGDAAARLQLAGDTGAEPEVLYYLATDEEAEVRCEVAANPSTPSLADRILSEDPSGEVRLELTRKITRLMPGLGDDKAEEVWEQTVEILMILADDQLQRVREILAEELKHSDAVPHGLVRKLASDAAESVSTPILEYSPLLNEQDLKEIIAAGMTRGALMAVARRNRISETLAEAIVGTLEFPAISELLANKSAEIREATMERIVDKAEGLPELHERLALRPNLSVRIIKRIAGFVASSLVHSMIEQNELPEEVALELSGRVRERLAHDEENEDEAALAKRVAALHAQGELNDEFMTEAIESRQKKLAVHALAQLAKSSVEKIDSVLATKNGRAVTALSWRCGLSMRTALVLQNQLAFVKRDTFLAARNGVDYPMSEEELTREAAFFLD